MVDQKHVFGLALNGARHALAMLRTKDERAEDQEIERALKKRDPVA